MSNARRYPEKIAALIAHLTAVAAPDGSIPRVRYAIIAQALGTTRKAIEHLVDRACDGGVLERRRAHDWRRDRPRYYYRLTGAEWDTPGNYADESLPPMVAVRHPVWRSPAAQLLGDPPIGRSALDMDGHDAR